MYTSLVDVTNISPSLILRLLKAAETYQVVQAEADLKIDYLIFMKGGDGEGRVGERADGGS